MSKPRAVPAPLPEQELPIRLLGDFAQEPVKRDLVRGVIPKDAIVFVYGLPGAGKTHWVLDLATHIATGKPFYSRDIEAGAVLYVAAEGTNGMRKRARAALMKHAGAGGWDKVPLFVVPQPVNLFSCDVPDVVRQIESAVCTAKLALVVIDTLNACLIGGDENASGDVSEFFDHVRELNRAFDCSTIIVHHSGKDPAKGMRGHSSMLGTVDTAIQVVAEGAGRHTAVIEKQRDGQTREAFDFSLTVLDVRLADDEAEVVDTCEVVHGGVTYASGAPIKKKALTAAAKILLGAFRDVPKTVTVFGHPARKGVTLPELRAEFERRYGTTSDPKSIQRAFERAREFLVAEGYVRVRGDIASEGGHAGP